MQEWKVVDCFGERRRVRRWEPKEGLRFADLLPEEEKGRKQVGAEGRFFQGVPVLAKIGSKLHELAEPVSWEGEEGGEQIVLLDTCDSDGYRVYMRSLMFVFILAVSRCLPDTHVTVEHSISGGLYCIIHREGRDIELDARTRDEICRHMKQLIVENRPITRREVPLAEARDLFEKMGRRDKLDLLRDYPGREVAIYELDGVQDSFYGYMVPSTGYLEIFSLELFDRGVVLLGPDRKDRRVVNNFLPTYLLSQTYNEAEKWSELQGISTAGDLNAVIRAGKIGDICRMTEALQSYRIMELAKEIAEKAKRLVLIAAPSSSGKTSFAYKLMTSLRVLGLRPVKLSLDDYFVDRDKTPLGADGKPDFEALEALDLPRFQSDLKKLLQGERVSRISFDFVQGKRKDHAEEYELGQRDPVIIEGIHGLNPALTRGLPQEQFFKIYLSVLTQINLDWHNRIPTTDLRLMRRMTRDMQFRGRSPRQTLREWPEVRRGEKRNIFPYQEEADAMFNSSFLYEIAAMKPYIEPELRKIGPEEEAYTEAGRLLSILKYFLPMESTEDVVNTSILREFIGGSRIVEN